MRFHGPVLAAAAAFLCSATAFPDDAPDGKKRPEISVLTPSMEGQFIVGAQYNLNQVAPVIGLPSDIVDHGRAQKLRMLVKAERYDPVRTIADRLIEALAAKGYDAVYEPVARRPAGSIQSLSWSDLPENPQGKLVLDVNIQWICLCSSTSYAKVFPGIALAWRLLDPARQTIVEPTRRLVYYHIPWDPPKRRDVKDDHPPPSPYPAVTVSEGCGYNSLGVAQENPAQLWGCFGEAFDVAVDRLAIDLAKLRPPPGPINVSAGSPSGTSTR